MVWISSFKIDLILSYLFRFVFFYSIFLQNLLAKFLLLQKYILLIKL